MAHGNGAFDVAKEPARIRRMFARIVPSYDFLNHLLSAGLDRGWRRATVEACAWSRPVVRPWRVLDVCAGTGDLAFEFARAGASVALSDFTREMLLEARSKGARRGVVVPLSIGDALRLPYASGSFDAASVGFGIRNVEDLDRGLAEMARVVRPGGAVAVLELAQPASGALRLVYNAYFTRVLPAIGQIVSRSPENAYAYLPRSVIAFPPPDALAERMRGAGLRDVTWRPLAAGICTLHVGRR